MINRVVLMKLNEKADSSVIAEMQTYVSRIGREIEQTQCYHLAPNEAAAKGDYNWVLTSAFVDQADMEAYREAPLHREFVAYCDPFTEDFLVACYRAPAG